MLFTELCFVWGSTYYSCNIKTVGNLNIIKRCALWHSETEQKWPPVCRLDCHVHLCEGNIRILIHFLLNFVPEGPMDNISKLPWTYSLSPLIASQHSLLGQANLLTHWGRDKMAAISQMTLSNPFSWMKIFGFRLKFHGSLFLRFQLTIFQHWFR